MKHDRVEFATPEGQRTHAPPAEMQRDADGRSFVWIRTRDDGDVTKAYQTGEL